MPIITWLALGAATGLIASRIQRSGIEGLMINMLLGVAGALFGGLMFSAFARMPVIALNPYRLVLVAACAVAAMAIHRAARRLPT